MAGKELQTTIEIAGVLSPSLQKSIQEAISRLDDMSQETLESAGAAEQLAMEISSQEDVLKSLKQGYEDYVVSGDEGSETAQLLAECIQDVSAELEQNKDTLKAAHEAAEKLTESQGDVGDAYSRLEDQIAAQEEELGSLRREYANVSLEQGENSKAAQRLAGQITDLSGDLNENKQKLNAAELAAGQLGEALEDAGGIAESSSEGYTVMKDVLASLVTDGIQAAAEAFKELVTEGDSSLAMLEARTGASSAEMEQYKDVMYDVYNSNYGESLGDVSETLSTVLQMTDDLDNASLAQITKNSIALEDVFGFDTVESLRAANSMMDKFGITADQAYNLIVQGAQNGLNQNDDLLDIINEYSVHFSKLGLSADDMFNVLASGAESGTFSVNKLGDAVKEFGISAMDDSDSTAKAFKDLGLDVEEMEDLFAAGGESASKAFQETLKRLGEMDNQVWKNQVGVALFGTMWEDLGEDTILALGKAEGAISSTANAMEQMDSAAYDTLESAMSQLGRTVSAEVLQPIARKLTPLMKDAVNFVNSSIAPAIDWLIDHLPEVGTACASIGAAMAAVKWGSIVSKLGEFKGVFTGISAVLGGISAPILAVIAGVIALAGAFTHLWRSNEKFRKKITGIWKSVQAKFEEFGQGITDRINALGFDFTNIAEVIGSAWEGFCSFLAPAFETAFGIVGSVIGTILDGILAAFDVFANIFSGDWSGAWEEIKSIATNAVEAIPGLLSAGWEALKSGISAVGTAIGPLLDSGWTALKTAASTAVENLPGALSAGWEALKSGISAVGTAIGPLLDSGWTALKTAASTAVENLPGALSAGWEALKSGISAVGTAIGPLLDSGWTALKTAASTAVENLPGALSAGWEALKSGISAVGTAIGPLLDSGWTALKDAAGPILENMPGIVSEKLEAVKTTVTNIGDGLGSLLDSGWEMLTGAAEGAANAVKSAWEGVKDFFGGIWNAITGGGNDEAAATVDTSAISSAEISIPLDAASIEAANEAVQLLADSMMAAQENALTFGDQISAVSADAAADTTTIADSMTAISETLSTFWEAITELTRTAWESILTIAADYLMNIQTAANTAMTAMQFDAEVGMGGILSTAETVFGNILTAVTNRMQEAQLAVQLAVGAMRDAMNFTWSLPNLKLPHIHIDGGFSIDPPTAPQFSVSWYKEGGILTEPTLFGLAGGEAGDEAVLPLTVLWDKLSTMIRDVFNSASTAGPAAEEPSLTAAAGRLLTIDDFSLGSLARESGSVVYYDFSGFTWSPQIRIDGQTDDDEFMARLKAHEAEFFDWLEEFIQMREEASYA